MRAKHAVSIQPVEVPAAPRARRYRTVQTKGSEQPYKLFGLSPKTVTSCLPLGSELACRAPLELSPPLVVKRKKSVRWNVSYCLLSLVLHASWPSVLVSQ